MLSIFKQRVLYSCDQQNVNHDDIGYILADAFKYENDFEFANKTLSRCDDFFDHPNKIKSIIGFLTVQDESGEVAGIEEF